jgi:hypothetical protein
MIIVKSQRATDSGGSSGARDDAGGSSGARRDTNSLPENLFAGGEPETEDSKLKKKKRRFKGKRIYQLGITVPEVDDESVMSRRSA